MLKNCCKISDCNIFIENLQKYFKCAGKHFVKVQFSIDTENRIVHRREVDGIKCHENDPTATYVGCKNKLNNKSRHMGYVLLVRYHNSALFENNIFN